MKKFLKLIIMIAIAAISLLVIFACSGAKTFHIEYIAGLGGNISGEKLQDVKEGEDGDLVVAIPDEGYVFKNWSDGNLNQVRRDKNIHNDISVTAYFKIEIIKHSIIYSALNGGYIIGATKQDIPNGEDADPIIALPKTGYKFVKWSDGVLTQSRHDEKIMQDVNIVAEFVFCFKGGNGTDESPYIIETYEQLYNIALFSHSYYILANDLNLRNIMLQPLFNNTNPFYGVFDGNGHTISNMKVDFYNNCPSLFGYIASGTIKNLNIIDFEIIVPNFDTSVGALSVGAIAGISWGVLDNINVSGSIYGNGLTYDGVAIGGLAGQAGGLVTNCHADVAIEIINVESSKSMSNLFNIGGLIGVGFANLLSCNTQGTINLTNTNGYIYVGGLAAYFLANKISDNFSIVDCSTNIKIQGNSNTIVAGLIAEIYVLGEIEIANCRIYGEIASSGYVGGLASYVTCSRKLIIIDSFVENSIKNANNAAGFIYWITNNYDVGGVFEIINCSSTGDLSSISMAAGFCMIVSRNVRFYRCYSTRTIQTLAGSAGFIALMTGGIIEECFSSGTITATHQAAGFIFTASEVIIKNCYSSSIINATNTDVDTTYRTLICGFVFYIQDSVISNCYYSGKLSGLIIATNPTGMDSIVADFIGTVSDSQIINCHILFYEDTFATDIIVELFSPIEDIELFIYNSIDEMISLADNLNNNLDEQVWENNEHGLPKLKFFNKN